IVTGSVTTVGLFGYGGTTDNRSVAIQQMGNASTATQYLFLNGGLGSSSVLGTPLLTSIYAPTFGFESSDNNLNILTASDGTNTTAVRAMSFSSNGNVGIGTTDTKGYKLAVNGDAIFTRVKVKPFINWPDYVFRTSYHVRPLNEVEAYIQQYHHLPDVSSA